MTLEALAHTATVWAAAGALIGAPIAWLAFIRERERARKEMVAGVENTLTGIEKELGLINLWASGGEGNPGYPWHGNDAETRTFYRTQNQTRDWCDPRRKIFGFDWPAIRAFPLSEYRGHFSEERGELVLLNYSLSALFGLYSEFRGYVLARPELYDASVGQPCPEPDSPAGSPTPSGGFRDQVFNYNYEIHVGRIGGFNNGDAGCLYNSYRAAATAIGRCRRAWEQSRPTRPWWYPMGNFVAALAVCAGVVLLLLWFTWAPGGSRGAQSSLISVSSPTDSTLFRNGVQADSVGGGD
jgi:hypothetical protein